MAKFRYCKVCDAPFEVKHQHSTKRYCSNKCKARASRKMRSIKEPLQRREPLRFEDRCAHCGNTYLSTRYGRLFCSNACRQAEYRARKRGQGNPILAEFVGHVKAGQY